MDKKIMQCDSYALRTKFGYGFTDVLGGGAFALISLLFLNFLVNVEGINAALAGVIVMIGKIFDAVSDPFMGIISDKTKSKFGRRRIYILSGVIHVLITFTLLWYSFGIEGTTAKFIYYCVAYILFSASFTVVMVPYNALLTDMVEDYKARASFSTIRMLVSNIAAAISVVVPPLLLGDGSKEAYLRMGFIFALLYAIPLIPSFFLTWEKPVSKDEQSQCVGEMFRQLAKSFKNKAYRQYLGIFVCGQMATDITTVLVAFWLTDILHMPNMMSFVSGITVGVSVLLLPLNNYIAKKHGKHIPALIEQPIKLVGLVFAFFMDAQSGFIMLVLICILNGIGTSASSFVPWSLLPDLPDSDELVSSHKNAGIYASMSTFIRKFTSGIAIFLVSLTLELFGYVEATAGIIVTQTETALLTVRVLYSFVPFVLTVITIILASRYTLTQQNHAMLKKAVTYKRETGKAIEDKEVIQACEKIIGMPFKDMWAGKNEKEN